MHFNQAPISRVVSTKDVSTSSFASPVVFSAGGVLGSSAVSLQSGKAITVFFDVPSCPMAASQVNIKLHESSANTGCGIHALPNVVMTDADSYLFIRGNSALPNGASPANANALHVVYSAVLENISPVNRTNVDAGSLVRAGDDLILDIPADHTSNIISVQSVTAKVLTVKHKGQNTYLIDFTVGVNATLTSGVTGWNANEVFFYSGAVKKGLAKDQMVLSVSGSAGGQTVWRGSLKSAVNLSYPSANKEGVIPAFNASETALVSKSWIASSGIPSVGNMLNVYSEVDYNSGAMPFKCVSIVDNTPSPNFYNLEISIIPLY